MSRRQFINSVRQYTTLAQKRATSFAEQVKALHALYLASVAENGAGEAEQRKEAEWAASFLSREYGKHDSSFNAGESDG